MAGHRETYVSMPPPKQLGLPADVVCKYIRCVDGATGAGMIWEETDRQALIDVGFGPGRASPCRLRQKSRRIALAIHADDFTALGKSDD